MVDLTQDDPAGEKKTKRKSPPREICPHSGQRVVLASHDCWVLEKSVKCHKCGQPNHIAMVCTGRGVGLGLNIRPNPDIINQLKQFLALANTRGLEEEEAVNVAVKMSGLTKEAFLEAIKPKQKKPKEGEASQQPSSEPGEIAEPLLELDAVLEAASAVPPEGLPPSVGMVTIPSEAYKIIQDWIYDHDPNFQRSGLLARHQ